MAVTIPEVKSPLDDKYAKERCSMYDDLIKNHLKTGMTLEEVEKMIGKTPMVGYCKGDQAKCLKYYNTMIISACQATPQEGGYSALLTYYIRNSSDFKWGA